MIPLFSNIGYSEISSAGNLSDAMGTAKSKLPIQYFKLTGNVSGNLTMPSNAAHRKIFLDTNGYSILNPSGSPITSNSSVPMILKGSGNIQSTKKTFTTTEATTTYTGTTTVPLTDGSTLVVGDAYSEIAVNGGYQPSFGTGAPNSSSIFQIADGQTGGSSNFGKAWRLRVPPGTSWKIDGTVITGGTVLTASQNNSAIGASNSFDKITLYQVVRDVNSAGDVLTTYPPSGWAANYANDGNKWSTFSANFGGGIVNHLVYNVGTGRWEAWHQETPEYGGGDNPITYGPTTYTYGYINHGRRGMAPPPQTITINVLVSGQGRQFDYTNNLAIPIVLTGTDPFNNVTVAAGATATSSRSSTDGSFNVIGTITGSNGAGKPYAMSYVNNGTGQLDITNYTGLNSVSAF